MVLKRQAMIIPPYNRRHQAATGRVRDDGGEWFWKTIAILLVIGVWSIVFTLGGITEVMRRQAIVLSHYLGRTSWNEVMLDAFEATVPVLQHSVSGLRGILCTVFECVWSLKERIATAEGRTAAMQEYTTMVQQVATAALQHARNGITFMLGRTWR